MLNDLAEEVWTLDGVVAQHAGLFWTDPDEARANLHRLLTLSPSYTQMRKLPERVVVDVLQPRS